MGQAWTRGMGRWARAGLLRAAVGLSAVALLTAARAPDPAGVLSLRILDTHAPPGGTIQLVATLTEPHPVVRALVSIAPTTTSASLLTIKGIALFGPLAATKTDIAGAAVVNGAAVSLRVTAPAADFGTQLGEPLLAIALGVSPAARFGTTGTLALDTATSLFVDLAGNPYPQVVKNGKFVVAGTTSIDDVVSGFGLLPAGSLVTIRGVGFQPGALVEIAGVPVSAAAVVSPNEIQVTLGAAADMYGREVVVVNPNFSRARYYGYLRGTVFGDSASQLLRQTYPLFSRRLVSAAFVPAVAPPGQFAALALQNPGPGAAAVIVELRSPTVGFVAASTITLPSRAKMVRAVGEIFLGNVTVPADAFLSVTASAPLQVLGLAGDDAAGTVDPVLPSPPTTP
jgi:IPT/TIG domain-containing protein